MTTNPTTLTTDPTSPAPAPPQSVRIETELWWEDDEHAPLFKSRLRLGDYMKMATVETITAGGNAHRWKIKHCIGDLWSVAPTREAAKAAALQAVMGAIGAREVGKE